MHAPDLRTSINERPLEKSGSPQVCHTARVSSLAKYAYFFCRTTSAGFALAARATVTKLIRSWFALARVLATHTWLAWPDGSYRAQGPGMLTSQGPLGGTDCMSPGKGGGTDALN